MSGEFRPEQVQQVESTDDPQLAQARGLTEYDEATGLYTAPAADVDHEDDTWVDALPSADEQAAGDGAVTTSVTGEHDGAVTGEDDGHDDEHSDSML